MLYMVCNGLHGLHLAVCRRELSPVRQAVVPWSRMSRTFKTVDYDATLDVTVRLGDCLPPDHLARFVVDTIAQLDLSALYARYGSRGGRALRPRNPAGLAVLRLCHRRVQFAQD